jgi:hypothetical protein
MNFYFHSTDTRTSFYQNLGDKKKVYRIKICESLRMDNKSLLIMNDLIKSLNYVRPPGQSLRLCAPFGSLIEEFLWDDEPKKNDYYPFTFLGQAYQQKGMIKLELNTLDALDDDRIFNDVIGLFIWDGMDIGMTEMIEGNIQRQHDNLMAAGYTSGRFYVLNTFTERIYNDCFYMKQLEKEILK